MRILPVLSCCVLIAGCNLSTEDFESMPDSHRDNTTEFEVGEIIPELAALDTAGQELKLSDYRGKVVLLFFWANW